MGNEKGQARVLTLMTAIWGGVRVSEEALNARNDFLKEQKYRASLYWLHIPVVQGAGSVGTSKRLDLEERERGRERQKGREGRRKEERGWDEEYRRQTGERG